MSAVLIKDINGHWSTRLREKNTFDPKIGPKGSSWKVLHRKWRNGGSEVFEAMVSNYKTGLTAFEAYQLVKWNCDPSPAYHEVVCEQLEPYPLPRKPKP